jgi:hypothetical protein
VQEALEGLGGVEPVEDVTLLLGRERGGPLDVVLDPRFCSGSWMCMYSMASVRQ